MAGNMESMLLGQSDSSSDDSDNEGLEEVTATGTAAAASALAATAAQPKSSPPAAPSIPQQSPTGPPANNLSKSELSSRLKSIYAPASKAAVATPPTAAAPVAQVQVQTKKEEPHPVRTEPLPQRRMAISLSTGAPPINQQVASSQPQYTGAPSSSSSSSVPQQVPQQQAQTVTANTASSTVRPLIPNRPREQQPQQQLQTPAPAPSSDPFEPTPLRTILQRPHANVAVQQASATQQLQQQPQQQQHQQPRQHQQQLSTPTPRSSTGSTGSTVPTIPRNTSHSSSVGAGSSVRSNIVSMSSASQPSVATSQISAEARAKLEREAKERKEKFLLFTRVLMKYLENKDPDMNERARAVIRECAEKNKKKEKGYESVTMSMQTRLRQTVGDVYWKKAEGYLAHFVKQKKKLADAKRQTEQTGQGSSSSSQATSKPQVDHARYALEQKKAAEARAAEMSKKQKEDEIRKKKIEAAQLAKSRAAALEKLKRENAAKMAQLKSGTATTPASAPAPPTATSPDSKRKRARTPTGAAAPPVIGNVPRVTTPASGEAAKAPVVPAAPQPPREYSDLMEMVDHAVTYDWTSAGLLFAKDPKADVKLDEEQRKLLYGTSARPHAPERSKERLPPALEGWGKRNVLTPRVAWARIRLREQKREFHEAQAVKVPVVGGMKLPTVEGAEGASSNSKSEPKKASPSTTWLNEDKAEEDKTLAVLSEATQIYLRSILEQAVIAARQRQNLDGIRLWHQLHGPQKPPLSLRLGCDVRRQAAQAQGNAAKTYQRMEQALERQPDGPAKVRDLKDEETLFQSSSMADLALRPRLARAATEADLNAKRSFEVYGGKDAAAPPLGRVPKRPKIILKDFVLGMEWADYAPQRRSVAALNQF